MPVQRTGGFEDGFLELVEEQLRHCRQELSGLERDIGRLQVKRADAAKRVGQLEELLRDNRQPREDRNAELDTASPSRPRGPIADADAVVALLREGGGAMHYVDIHKTLIERGFQIGGEGNPNTLLSRFFKDERLVRVARGTYDLADRKPSRSRFTGPSGLTPVAPNSRPVTVPNSVAKGRNGRESATKRAEKVLRAAGRPLHTSQITELVLKDGWQTTGKTPDATVGAVLAVDIKRKGEASVFVRTAPGIYGLRGRDT